MAQQTEKNRNESTTPRTLKVIICILVLLVIGLAIATIILSLKNSNDSGSIDDCVKTTSLKPKYTKSKDLYRDLSENELLQVYDYMLKVAPLNITPFENATINSNYIFLIELQNPIKDYAIAYLDYNKPKPIRTANVIIFKGAETPPTIEEILVYFDTPMRHERNKMLTNNKIPFHARPINSLEMARTSDIMNEFGEKAHDILKESFDGFTIVNCSDRCLSCSNSAPVSVFKLNEHDLFTVACVRAVNGEYLHPVGLEFLIQRSESDVSKWKIEKVK